MTDTDKKSNKIKILKPRLSAEDRRSQIIAAAMPLFARAGFRGVTTKMLALETGVSEALLYQHFPSKEALYEAVQGQCLSRLPKGLEPAIGALPPSTATLVQLLFFLAKIVVERPEWAPGTDDLFPRLMLHSVLEDGGFARMHLSKTAARMQALMAHCFDAARSGGDLAEDGVPDDVRFWLCHHVLVTLHLYQLPSPPVVTYSDGDPAHLVDYALRFMLRGIGLSAAAVAAHYDYQRLDATVLSWLSSAT